MPGKRTGSAGGTLIPENLKKQIGAALGRNVNVVSAVYKGRDKAGMPMYTIRYTVSQPYGTRSGVYHRNQPTAVVRTITYRAGKIGQPYLQDKGVPGADPQAPSADAQLRMAKDRWMAWITNLDDSEISNNERQGFLKNIQNYKGTAAGLDRWMNVAKSNLPFGSTAVQGETTQDDWLTDFLGGLGDGSSGMTGPEYRAPDRRVVEDMAKGMMLSLTGMVNEDQIDTLANLYMRDHRRDFDSPNAEINPEQSVLEAIRGTDAYLAIHANRPDTEDERTWVSSRKNVAEQGGLNLELQDEFAIEQAQVGSDLADSREAAGVEQLAVSGSARGTLMEDRIRQLNQAMFAGVR